MVGLGRTTVTLGDGALGGGRRWLFFWFRSWFGLGEGNGGLSG